MTCDRCSSQLGDYVDGHLPAAERAEVESHLRDCAACQEDLDGLRLAVSAMQSLEPVEPPAWLLGSITAALDAAGPARRRVWAWSWQQASALAVAACVLVGFVAVFHAGVGVPTGEPVAVLPHATPLVAPRPEALPAGSTTKPATIAAAGAGGTVAEPGAAAAAPARRPHPRPGPRAAVVRHAAGPGTQAPRPASSGGSRSPVGPVPAPLPQPAPGPFSSDPGGAGMKSMDMMEGPAVRGAAAALAGPSGTPGLIYGPGDDAAALSMAARRPAMAMARGAEPRPNDGIDVQFVPPREREVGRESVAVLVLRPTCEFERAEVRVETARGMTVANARGAGVVFEGPLAAGRRTTVPLRLVAAKPGRQALQVMVDTDPPGGSTHLDVAMPGFATATASEADETGLRLRRDVSLSVRPGCERCACGRRP